MARRWYPLLQRGKISEATVSISPGATCRSGMAVPESALALVIPLIVPPEPVTVNCSHVKSTGVVGIPPPPVLH